MICRAVQLIQIFGAHARTKMFQEVLANLKKKVFFLHLHQVLRGRLQYLLRCPAVNLWSAVQLVLQGVQE